MSIAGNAIQLLSKKKIISQIYNYSVYCFLINLKNTSQLEKKTTRAFQEVLYVPFGNPNRQYPGGLYLQDHLFQRHQWSMTPLLQDFSEYSQQYSATAHFVSLSETSPTDACCWNESSKVLCTRKILEQDAL